MYLAVKDVVPLSDYKLKLTFSNGENKIFDVKPYLNLEIFQKLSNVSFFQKVRVNFDTIEWPNNADFDPEFLFEKSDQISSIQK